MNLLEADARRVGVHLQLGRVSDTRRETISLIGSDKVEGTAVYGGDSKKIGKIERVMIDKISGTVQPVAGTIQYNFFAKHAAVASDPVARLNVVREVMRLGQELRYETVILHRDGSRIPVD